MKHITKVCKFEDLYLIHNIECKIEIPISKVGHVLASKSNIKNNHNLIFVNFINSMGVFHKFFKKI